MAGKARVVIADSRIAEIRSLTAESQKLTAELMDELDPWDPDFQHLRIAWNYLRRVINKTNILEAP